MDEENFIPPVCAHCKYADPYLNDNLNFCRKNAPFGELSCEHVPSHPGFVWPLVKDDDWCGEFAPHED